MIKESLQCDFCSMPGPVWRYPARSFVAYCAPNVAGDRKSTRLNSSHLGISYAVFFFNDRATTEIYPLSLHDALPICAISVQCLVRYGGTRPGASSLTARRTSP